MSEQTTLIEKAGQVLAKYQQSLASPKIDGAVVIASALLAVAGELEKHTALLDKHTEYSIGTYAMVLEEHLHRMRVYEADLAAAKQARDGAA